MCPTDREYGKLCRQSLVKDLHESWGELTFEGSWLKSTKTNNRILTLYSDLHNNHWFFGIQEDYWKNWNNDSYLVFIMRDNIFCSYVLLTPEESSILLEKINWASDKSKKIHIRIPSTGKMYIQQWPQFPCQDRIINIGSINPKESLSEMIEDAL